VTFNPAPNRHPWTETGKALAMIDPELLEALRVAVGAANLRVGDKVDALDPGAHPDNLKAGIVVSPGATDEVAAVVKLCAARCVGIVSQGGRTGLVGGAVSSAGQIILSTNRLNRIIDLDPVARVAVVEAGVTLEKLQTAARRHRLEPGIDVPSRGSATIGGMTSTNAGGILAFRNGVMRHQVLGLEAVLADGSIYSDLTRVVKNTAGYDLKQLFIGAEGTLGVVTRVALKLEVTPAASATAFFGLPSVAAVLDLIRLGLDSNAGALRAAEALWRDYFRLTSTNMGFVDPSIDPSMPIYLLLSLGGPDRSAMHVAFERIYADPFDRYPGMCGVIAASSRQEQDLWRLREDTEVIYRAYPAAPSFDVSVPLSRIEAYVDEMMRGLKALDPSLEPFVFGHLADGNLHVVLNRSGPMPEDLTRAVEEVLYRPLSNFGGSLSAEHGIGSKRIEALNTYANPTKLRLMRTLRRAIGGSPCLFNEEKILFD
jgi:FAD/FMN-containing dehydrogenase